jgi:hypothetical protein
MYETSFSACAAIFSSYEFASAREASSYRIFCFSRAFTFATWKGTRKASTCVNIHQSIGIDAFNFEEQPAEIKATNDVLSGNMSNT